MAKKIIVPQEPEEKEAKKKDRSQEMQKKVLQFQILQANLQLLAERERHFAEKLAELEETRQALEDLKDVKRGDSIMVPLGSGNFIAGEIKDCEKVLVGFGAGVVIKKSQEDARKIIDKRAEELSTALHELGSQIQHVEFELHKLQPELQELSKG